MKQVLCRIKALFTIYWSMKAELNKDELIGIADSLLQDGRSVSFKMQGYSMYPTLKPGDEGLVERCALSDLRIGDIVVFKSAQKLIAHRLTKIVVQNNIYHYIARGDHNRQNDAPFTQKAFVGKVVSYERDGRTRKVRATSPLLPEISIPYYSLILLFRNLVKRFVGSWSSLRSNYQLVASHSRREILNNLTLSLLQGIVPLGTILCIKLLIDFLSAPVVPSQQLSLSFWLLLILTAFLFFANALLNGIKKYYSERLSQSVSRWVHELLHTKHGELELSHYENPEEQNRMHRAVQQAGFRPVKLINELLLGAKSVVAVLIMLGMFSAIRWYLIFPLVLIVIPGVLVRFRASARFYKLKQEHSAPEREMFYFNRVLTGFPFAKELRLFGFASYFQTRFNKVQDKLFTEKTTLQRHELKWEIVAQLFSALMIFLMIGYVAYLKMRGEISMGTVVLFFFLFQRGYAVMNDLFRSVTLVLEDNSYLDDFAGFIRTPVPRKENDTKRLSPLQQKVEVEGVSFAYESSHRKALDNVSLTIPAGKTVAFVGANGSGKTTMVKLLCGFYRPQSGRIFYDETDIAEVNRDAVSEQVTAVFQDFALYNISAGENIGLGKPETGFDDQKIREAAHSAGVADVLAHLPKGYNTMLGNLFTGGEELSIGQWQKMAIARAFYRDAPILFMDEPSSALDVESEALILDKLRHLSNNKTVVIVSHRLSTVQWADIIYHFEEGRIVESGSHDELMARQGRYWQFVNLTVTTPMSVAVIR